MNREIRLAARPHGLPRASDFELAETPVPEPAEGEALIRNVFMSVDPYMRGRMNDVRSYVPPFELGEPLSGGAVGQVVESRLPGFAPGDWVLSMLGWREWRCRDAAACASSTPSAAPVSSALGVLGHAGAHRLRRPARHRAAEGGRDRVRVGRGRSGRQHRRPDREAARAAASSAVPARTRRSPGCSTSSASTLRSTTRAPTSRRAEGGRAGGHPRLLRQRRRRPPRGGARRAAPVRARRRLRDDLALQRRDAGARAVEHDVRRRQAAAHPGLHRQ